MSAFLPAADLMIDHVSISGRDLKSMQAALAAIGIPSEFGGAHSNGATQMAVTSFPDGSYLELIALQTNPDQKALAAHYWSKQMLGDAGPTAWAVRSKDVSAEVARLRAAGIVVGAPSHSGRKRPDGVELNWETARIGEEPQGTFFPFLIRDISPRDARAFPSGRPTTTEYTGVKRVIIAVRSLPASIARYRKAYALPAPEQHDDAKFGARMAVFPGTPVILAAPLDRQSWINKRIDQFGEGPCAFLLGSKRAGNNISWFEQLPWRLGVEH